MKAIWTLIAYIFFSISPTPLATPVSKIVKVNGETFTYAFFRSPPTDISLIPNFDSKTDVTSLILSNTCNSAVNGGFYDTKSQPLGYFVTKGQKIHNSIQSTLLNGYFWIDEGKASITSTPPSKSTGIALQTGPMLVENGKPRILHLSNDEHARRMIAVIENTGNVIFLTLYNTDAVFEGPLLRTLPELVDKIALLESLGITSAINLDGGSASAFYSDTTKLSELTLVGSVFCIK